MNLGAAESFLAKKALKIPPWSARISNWLAECSFEVRYLNFDVAINANSN